MQFLAPHTNIFPSVVLANIAASNHEWENETSRNLGPVEDLILGRHRYKHVTMLYLRPLTQYSS